MAENQLTGIGRQLFRDLYEKLVEDTGGQIQLAFQGHEDFQQIGADDLIRRRSADSIMARVERSSTQSQAGYI